MADENDDSQKTEEPSRKRLEDAAERGQVITSREATSFFLLLAFTLVFSWIGPTLFRKTEFSLSRFIEQPDQIPMDNTAIGTLMISMIVIAAKTLIVPFIAFLAAVIFASAIQNRFVFSFEPIIPKLEKISPMKGLGKLFSMRSISELVKGIIKMVVVSIIAYYAVEPYFSHFKQLPDSDTRQMLVFLAFTTNRMLLGICIIMFFIAIFDYLYQRYEYLKSLRMSKQELKDEYKQQEGDPQVKQRLRQIRTERAKKRMIAAVPTADVIVTNPTHYSVALKYDADKMRAPIVVAKGLDNVALRIREIAKEHNIPLYENKPLAQALYATVEIDREVPSEHYKAVAEVISYVYRLKGKFKK